MFNVGDIVRPMFLDDGGYGYLAHYSGELSLHKEYEVLDIKYADEGQMIRLQNDRGYFGWMYAIRFNYSEVSSNETPVIRKIRQMEEKRKSLGYRW